MRQSNFAQNTAQFVPSPLRGRDWEGVTSPHYSVAPSLCTLILAENRVVGNRM